VNTGSYKKSNDEDSHSNDSAPIESPKEKERLRDRLMRNLGKKSTKNNQNSDQNLEIAKDRYLMLEYFGPNLEKVEKDTTHELVPKIVVDCIKIIENSENIKTAGLYRVSGNKTQIETFKKKSNDKKVFKKEQRLPFLESQDVHCLTGILVSSYDN
jgi:RhoGAP domain